MNPRRPTRTDPVTWEGIELMISERLEAHDTLVSLPRHKENIERFEKIEKDVKSLMKTISEWSLPMKAMIAMEGIILLGVLTLVGDLIVWWIKNGNYTIGK